MTLSTSLKKLLNIDMEKSSNILLVDLAYEEDKQNMCASSGDFSKEDSFENQISSDHERAKFFKCIRWPYKCTVCDSSVSQENYIPPQIISVHEEKKPFKCNVCDTSFYENSTLKKHIEFVHEKKKSYKCYVCNDAFSRNSQLIGHLAFFHEGKKPYDCIVCDRSFGTSVL